MVGPATSPATSTLPILRTIEDMYQLTPIGDAATHTPSQALDIAGNNWRGPELILRFPDSRRRLNKSVAETRRSRNRALGAVQRSR